VERNVYFIKRKEAEANAGLFARLSCDALPPRHSSVGAAGPPHTPHSLRTTWSPCGSGGGMCASCPARKHRPHCPSRGPPWDHAIKLKQGLRPTMPRPSQRHPRRNRGGLRSLHDQLSKANPGKHSPSDPAVSCSPKKHDMRARGWYRLPHLDRMRSHPNSPIALIQCAGGHSRKS